MKDDWKSKLTGKILGRALAGRALHQSIGEGLATGGALALGVGEVAAR